MEVPPSSVLRTSARLATTLSGEVITSSGQNKGVLLPNTLVKAVDVVPIQLVNDTEIPISIHVGHVLGYTVECDAVLIVVPEETMVSKVDTQLPEHLVMLFQRSKRALNEKETEILKSLLVEFQDIFPKETMTWDVSKK